MHAVVAATVPTKTLAAVDRDEMFDLLSRYYLGVTEADFARDLAGKEHVMLLREGIGRVVGFSTLLRFDLATCAGTVRGIFSGDTIVEESYRRTLGFATELAHYLEDTRRTSSGKRTFYFLISKGWRTYRILPFLFKDFHPTYRATMPREHREVRDAFGNWKYPREYDPRTGRIVFDHETQRIRSESAEAFDPRRNDPHVAFFFQANPHYLRGDELVCVAEVTPDNYTEGLTRLIAVRGCTWVL